MNESLSKQIVTNLKKQLEAKGMVKLFLKRLEKDRPAVEDIVTAHVKGVIQRGEWRGSSLIINDRPAFCRSIVTRLKRELAATPA